MKDHSHTMQFLNRIGTFQFHQLVAVSRLDPADSEIGNQKANHMGFSEVSDEGCTVVVALVTADVASGDVTLISQALCERLETENQVVDQIAVLLSKAGKHEGAP